MGWVGSFQGFLVFLRPAVPMCGPPEPGFRASGGTGSGTEVELDPDRLADQLGLNTPAVRQLLHEQQPVPRFTRLTGVAFGTDGGQPFGTGVLHLDAERVGGRAEYQPEVPPVHAAVQRGVRSQLGD